MASGPSIIARLGLDTAPFQKEMSNSVSLASAGAARIGAAFGAIGFAAIGRQIVEWASSLQDSADALDINVEALQELNYAFGQSGTSAQKVEAGLSKLTQQMAAAKDGNKEALKSFVELGVTLEQIKNLSPDQVLMLMADGLRDAHDPAAALDAVLDLLGKSGRRMAAGMREGAEGIAKLREEASKLDAGSVAALDQAGDLMSRFGTSAKVLLSKFGVGLVHAVNPFRTMGGNPSSAAPTAAELNSAQSAAEARKNAIAKDTLTIEERRERSKFIEKEAEKAINEVLADQNAKRDLADNLDEQRNDAADELYKTLDDILEAQADLNHEIEHERDVRKQIIEDANAAYEEARRNQKVEEASMSPDERREQRRGRSKLARTIRSIDAREREADRVARANGRQLEPREPGPAEAKPAEPNAKDGAATEDTLVKILDAVKGKFVNQ